MNHKTTSIAAGLVATVMTITACGAVNSTGPGSLPPLQAGPATVTGKVTYTNSFFTGGVAEPIVILEDQSGFVKRDRKFVIPVESQVLGKITSDFYTSPFTYVISLPVAPSGGLNDVDHDGQKDAGVMIFAVAYWTNTWGDAYLERRDQGGGGWSTAYASTRVSQSSDSYLEVIGGKYVVYAPDDSEQFPSGFGADKKLFTDDDPLMPLPAGWSEIDLDKHPFGIDRSQKLSIDLLEGEGAEQDDFSSMSYTQAFDAMLDKFRREYAFTEFKGIDWDAKATEFRPLFEAAERQRSPHAYALALRDFMWSIPDTHVGFDQTLINGDFQNAIGGGLGLGIRETDDGKTIASYILEGGPADKAGVKWGAQVLTLDGKPIGDVVAANVPWSSPFSNPVIKRLQQLRYATRFPLDKGSVQVGYQNPGGPLETKSIPVVNEVESFNQASFSTGDDATLPVDYRILPSGLGYLRISSFLDNDILSIQVWERAMREFNKQQVPGVIIDMRQNSGGSGWLANQMAAYFFDQETVVGKTMHYDKATAGFYLDPADESLMIPPPKDLRYSGRVAVMVGPACASACEFFSYDMTIQDRALVVGQYPSEGAGGSVEAFYMPEGIYCQLTTGRALDANEKIHLEGRGVVPGVKVPVTVETLRQQLEGVDVVLEAAEEALQK
ncbi:MAG TPA: S41 family peptidase [Anaerolineales bacterium]|nr:S41 family peptidase [Anaerolineales bacterium]